MSIDTLGEAESLHWRVIATCMGGNGCKVRERLNMRALVWTRGRAFSLAELGGRLRCPQCGSRDVRVTFDVPTTLQPKSEFDQPRFIVETYDRKGHVVEVIAHVAKLDDAIRAFEETVARKPSAHVVCRSGIQVHREQPKQRPTD